MKFYFSSYRIPRPDILKQLVGKEPSKTKTAVIVNAKDYKSPPERKLSIDELLKDLQAHGYLPDVFDLRGFNPEKLEEKLSGYKMLYVAGGNTFVLRYEMRRSGFEIIISRMMKKGLVYVGESAGAIVAGKSLKGIEYADEPKFAEQTIWEGLKLINKNILPHADSADFKDAISYVKKVHQDDPNLVVLKDTQCFVHDNTKEQILDKL